jgi:hypothetical protein
LPCGSPAWHFPQRDPFMRRLVVYNASARPPTYSYRSLYVYVYFHRDIKIYLTLTDRNCPIGSKFLHDYISKPHWYISIIHSLPRSRAYATILRREIERSPLDSFPGLREKLRGLPKPSMPSELGALARDFLGHSEYASTSATLPQDKL